MRELCYIIEFMVLFQSLMQSSNPKTSWLCGRRGLLLLICHQCCCRISGQKNPEVHFSPFDLLVPLWFFCELRNWIQDTNTSSSFYHWAKGWRVLLSSVLSSMNCSISFRKCDFLFCCFKYCLPTNIWDYLSIMLPSATKLYPAFVQNSGPLVFPGQRPSSRE